MSVMFSSATVGFASAFGTLEKKLKESSALRISQSDPNVCNYMHHKTHDSLTALTCLDAKMILKSIVIQKTKKVGMVVKIFGFQVISSKFTQAVKHTVSKY